MITIAARLVCSITDSALDAQLLDKGMQIEPTLVGIGDS